MYVLRVESSLLQRYFCNIADCDRQGNLIAPQGFLGFLGLFRPGREQQQFYMQKRAAVRFKGRREQQHHCCAVEAF
jgi:hypothetical protein